MWVLRSDPISGYIELVVRVVCVRVNQMIFHAGDGFADRQLPARPEVRFIEFRGIVDSAEDYRNIIQTNKITDGECEVSTMNVNVVHLNAVERTLFVRKDRG